jgi:excisionase family DNA binding protein
MDFEPLTIRVVDASQLTGFPDYKIRKLIKTGELKAVRVGRSVLIDFQHFKAFCIRHRQHEIRLQKVVNLHWPIARRGVR